MPRRERETAEDRKRRWKPTLMDLAILEQLPLEGSALGLHQLGATVPVLVETLKKKYGDDSLTSSMVGGRMTSLKFMGYAAAITLVPVNQGTGWQITEKGKQLLADNEQKLKEVTEGGNA
jgi:hypothetical protein